MKRSKFFTVKNIVYLAVLLAIVVVLQAFTTALQSLTVVNLNLSLVPIVIGAILLGPAAGAFLGLACGIVVLIQVITGGSNVFYMTIWSNSPIVTTLTCLVKTTVAGFVAGIVYKAIAKKSPIAATFVASGLVPVINTALFIVGCLCMSAAIQSLNADGANLFVFIVVGIVTWNFFIEFAISLVLAPAIHRIVVVTERYIMKKKTVKTAVPAEISDPSCTECGGESDYKSEISEERK